jgi:cytochrome P450 family 110
MRLDREPTTPALIQTLQVIANPIAFLETYSKRYGDAMTIRVLGINSPPVALFSDPEAIKEIFAIPAEQLDYQKATHVFKPLMGERSLIQLEGKKHQRQRQLMLPSFHGDRMKTYGELICQITEEAIALWQPGDRISLDRVMSDITLQIILQVVFGINPGEKYECLKKMLSELLEDITNPWYSSLFFFPPLQNDWGAWSPWGQFLRRRQKIDRLIYAEIAQRRKENDPTRTDILSMLMAARDENGEQMSDEELRDQLVSLLLLGYETTAAALAWTFHLIHAHPLVKDRLQQEIDRAETKSPEAISRLPYLSAVCQETLRLYPIGLICTPRMAIESIEISGDLYEAGTILVPCIYLAHRRSQTYPQPEQFQPERFLAQKFSPFEYIPFGGGSRGCIGAAFSLYEMKLIVATILSRFHLSASDTRRVYPVRRGITIVPSPSGRKMRVKSKRQIQELATVGS